MYRLSHSGTYLLQQPSAYVLIRGRCHVSIKWRVIRLMNGVSCYNSFTHTRLNVLHEHASSLHWTVLSVSPCLLLPLVLSLFISVEGVSSCTSHLGINLLHSITTHLPMFWDDSFLCDGLILLRRIWISQVLMMNTSNTGCCVWSMGWVVIVQVSWCMLLVVVAADDNTGVVDSSHLYLWGDNKWWYHL